MLRNMATHKVCSPLFLGSLSFTTSQYKGAENAYGGRKVSRSSDDLSVPSTKATQVEAVPPVPFGTGSALLLSHFGLHDVSLGPPSIARNAHPTNITASLGRTARLRCRILNLAQKSVRGHKSSLIITAVRRAVVNKRPL